MVLQKQPLYARSADTVTYLNPLLFQLDERNNDDTFRTEGSFMLGRTQITVLAVSTVSHSHFQTPRSWDYVSPVIASSFDYRNPSAPHERSYRDMPSRINYILKPR